MRIQVNLSDELLDEVDAGAKRLGITRSSYIVTIIAQAMDNQKTAVRMMQELSVQLSKEMVKVDNDAKNKK